MTRNGFFAALALLATACGDNGDVLQGYAEGEFVQLAPETAGRVAEISVAEGAHVDAGAVLFRLDDTAERATLEAARAAAAAAAARLDDATAGGRAPEIAAAREQLEQARATQIRARQDRQRMQELFATGAVPRARLDDAVAAAETADARVSEMRQRVTLAQLPARDNQIRAFASAADEAQAQVQVAEEALRRRAVHAPAAGRVERVLRYAGDLAAPGTPAIRFLPDGKVQAILFVSQPRLAQTPVGTKLSIGCDGCPEDMTAEIVSISGEAEFTPPVIYSDSEREKLVYRAEARFTGFTPPPGTPLRAEKLP